MESRPPSLLVDPDPVRTLSVSEREISEFLGVRGFLPILVLYEDLELDLQGSGAALGADGLTRNGSGELLVHINSLLGAHLRCWARARGRTHREGEGVETGATGVSGCLGKIA